MEKPCRKCGVVRQLSEFPKHAQMRDGHENTCKWCTRKQYLVWAAKNREHLRDYAAQWRADNPDRFRELFRASQARYQRTAKFAAKDAVRRQRRRLLTAAAVSLDDVLAKYGRRCHVCGRPISDGLQFDHVVPLSRGGAHCAENLRPSHGVCNAWKGDRLPEELVGLTPPSLEQIQRRDLERRARRAIRRRSPRPAYHVPLRTKAAIFAAKGLLVYERKRKPKSNRSPGTPCNPKGHVANLRPWTPEARAKAMAALAAKRARGETWVTVTPESSAKISASLKLAYASGRRKRGHTEETKRKISETKRARSRQQ